MPPKKYAPPPPQAQQPGAYPSYSQVTAQKKAIADFGTQMYEENKRLKTYLYELADQLQNLYRDSEETINKYNQHINELEADKARYESEIQDLEKQIVASKGAAQQALDQRKALKVEADQKLLDRLRQREMEIDQLKIQNQDLELQLARVRQENQGIHEQIYDLAQNFQDKEGELQMLYKDYDDLQAKTVAPASSFRQMPTIEYQNKADVLQATIEQEEEPEVVEAGVAQREEQRGINTEINKKLRLMIDEGKELISKQYHQLSEKTGVISSLYAYIDQLNQDLAGQNAEVEKLNDENAGLKYQMEELDNQLKLLHMEDDPTKGSYVSAYNASYHYAYQSQLAYQAGRPNELRPNELITEHTLSVPGAQTLEQVNYNELRSKINNLNQQVKELEGFKKRFLDLQTEHRALRAELNSKSIECKRLQNFVQTGEAQSAELAGVQQRIEYSNVELLSGLDTQPKFRKLQEERKLQRSNPSILDGDDADDLKEDLVEAEKEICELKEQNAFLLNANQQFQDEIRKLAARPAPSAEESYKAGAYQRGAQEKRQLFTIEVRDFAVQVSATQDVISHGSNLTGVSEFVQTDSVFRTTGRAALEKLPKSLQDDQGVDHFETDPDVFDFSGAGTPRRIRLLGNQLVDNTNFQKVHFSGFLKRDNTKFRVLDGVVQYEPSVERQYMQQEAELSAYQELQSYKSECDRLQMENDSYRRQIAELQQQIGESVSIAPQLGDIEVQTDTTSQAIQPATYPAFYPMQQPLPWQYTTQTCPYAYGYQTLQPQPFTMTVPRATSPTIPDVHDYQPPAASCYTEQYFVPIDKYQALKAKYQAAMGELTQVQLNNALSVNLRSQLEQKQKELKASLDHIKYLNEQNKALERQLLIYQENIAQFSARATPACDEVLTLQNAAIKQNFIGLQTRLSQKQAEVDNLSRLLEQQRNQAHERIEFLQNQILQLNKAKAAAEDMQLLQLKSDLVVLSQTGDNELVKSDCATKVQSLRIEHATLEEENHKLRKEISRVGKAAKLVKMQYEENIAQLGAAQRQLISLKEAFMELCARGKHTDAAELLRRGDIDGVACCVSAKPFSVY